MERSLFFGIFIALIKHQQTSSRPLNKKSLNLLSFFAATEQSDWLIHIKWSRFNYKQNVCHKVGTTVIQIIMDVHESRNPLKQVKQGTSCRVNGIKNKTNEACWDEVEVREG